MTSNTVRKSFLAFYKERGHTVVPSASLIPHNDPSLLFTGAGMNQFKDRFLGLGQSDYIRATSSQKCFRTPDIEKVGRTASHHTFFEMLGNFSFGDYFKTEAIGWAWEFLTRHLRLPAAKLTVSVYERDDEAWRIWEKEIGVPAARIFRYGEADNFWPASAPSEGPNGPCGPCSEIFYDWGGDKSCGLPDCGPRCECGRFVEIWNLVFMQYERKEGGVLVPLPRKNIDTGMGLERITAILQGVRTNFETDLFKPLIAGVSETLKTPYVPTNETGALIRRIADHLRGVVFAVGDGILPSNEGRGYVIRRILRRAVRDGNHLGATEPFLNGLVPLVTNVMKEAYPELQDREPRVRETVREEERRFLETLAQGTQVLGEMVGALQADGKKLLPGADAFRLYDTYGFPLEMTVAELRRLGLGVDEKGFQAEMECQREKARLGSGMAKDIFGGKSLKEIPGIGAGTEFTGYGKLGSDGRVLAVLAGGEGEDPRTMEAAAAGEPAGVILDRTPFYGESGGQAGDRGKITWEGGEFDVADTRKTEGVVIHRGTVKKGRLKANRAVRAEVDAVRRMATARHHTATHLLQFALRSVLGSQVEQAGSQVSPDRLRFDFTHYAAVAGDALEKIEGIVNARVLENTEVVTHEMTLEEARSRGALAFFGEKYGDRVRMVEIGDFSRELCGGTHVRRTGDIGPVRILYEGSVAAGVRRIEMVAGSAAMDYFLAMERQCRTVAAALDVPEKEVPARVQKLLDEVKVLRKEISDMRRREMAGGMDEILAKAVDVKGIRVILAELDAGMEELKALSDDLRRALGEGVIVLAGKEEGRVGLFATISDDLVKRGLSAGDLVKTIAPIVGGKGGGKPVSAQAGGRDAAKIPEALAAARAWVEGKLQ
ncbi:MAG: alanine--tRNA ligase [Planctomycetota bacterium]